MADSIDTSSIVSAEAFGTPSVQRTESVTGIASAEAFGTAALVQPPPPPFFGGPQFYLFLS